ncbi:MAG: DUF177 domain-containing protein [Nitrospiria bacterium]
MQIEVEEIPQSGLHLSFELTGSEPAFKERGVSLTAPAHIDLVAHRHQEQEVYVQGRVDATLGSECDRCLKRYGHPVQVDFYFDFIPRPESPRKPGEEGSNFHNIVGEPFFYEGHQIEIDNEIADQLLLALPIRLLCTTDCQGLCPQCGTDLNDTKCACPTELPDFCWAALKNFQVKGLNAKSKT